MSKELDAVVGGTKPSVGKDGLFPAGFVTSLVDVEVTSLVVVVDVGAPLSL